jgi:hypothetical protein
VAVLSLVIAKRWPLNLLDMRSEMMAEAFSSPALMAHYLSATRHVPNLNDLADEAAQLSM